MKDTLPLGRIRPPLPTARRRSPTRAAVGANPAGIISTGATHAAGAALAAGAAGTASPTRAAVGANPAGIISTGATHAAGAALAAGAAGPAGAYRCHRRCRSPTGPTGPAGAEQQPALPPAPPAPPELTGVTEGAAAPPDPPAQPEPNSSRPCHPPPVLRAAGSGLGWAGTSPGFFGIIEPAGLRRGRSHAQFCGLLAPVWGGRELHPVSLE